MCHQPSYRRWNSINLKHAILTFTSANERKGERTRLYATIRLYMRVSIYCQALILNGLSPTVVLHRALCSWPIINVGEFYLCRSFLSLLLPSSSLDTNICESFETLVKSSVQIKLIDKLRHWQALYKWELND